MCCLQVLAVYCPEEGIECYGEFEVEVVEREECSGFNIRKLIVCNTKVGI